MSKPTCFVCSNTLNISTRKPINCIACNFSACRACYYKYILESYGDPCCMQCRRPWTRRFLADSCTQVFITGPYLTHRQNVLFEQERALLAYTQSFVERDIRADEVSAVIREEEEIMTKLKNEITALYSRRNQSVIRIRQLTRMRREILGELPTARETARFVRKCTAPDCLGFLSSQWKCGICSLWSCPDCFAVKGAERDVEHTCDPDTLATAKLIANDTKMCPKCGMGIYKIEGCNMMFCTECHTSFDWRTNAIITRNIHNPHYFEWRAQAGNTDRDPTEVACGRELDNVFVRNLFSIMRNLDKAEILDDYVAEVAAAAERLPEKWNYTMRTTVQRLMELAEILPEYATNVVTDNLSLRVSYMRGRIPELAFKTEIESAERVLERKRELGQIYGMVVHSATDILYRMYADLRARLNNPPAVNNVEERESACAAKMMDIIGATFLELEALRMYANESLRDLSRIFGRTPVPLFAVHLRLGSMGYPKYTTGTEATAAALERRQNTQQRLIAENAGDGIGGGVLETVG